VEVWFVLILGAGVALLLVVVVVLGIILLLTRDRGPRDGEH
jgi:hypothetical protein